MKQYREISSLFTKDLVQHGTIRSRYKPLSKYGLKPSEYVRILSDPSSTHPLAKRFNKLVRYTSTLIGNPNIDEIKKTYISILNRQLSVSDITEFEIHELIHVLLGQNIKIFLEKKLYSFEEKIYESIVVSIEDGFSEGVDYIFETFVFSPVMHKAEVSPIELYADDFEVINLFFKENPSYGDERKRWLKNLFMTREIVTTNHVYRFLMLYKIDPSMPLAINFKNQFLEKFSRIVTDSHVESYKRTLYKTIPLMLKYSGYYEDLRRLIKNKFKKYLFTKEILNDVIVDVEILPEETKNIIKKFVIYSCALLERSIK